MRRAKRGNVTGGEMSGDPSTKIQAPDKHQAPKNQTRTTSESWVVAATVLNWSLDLELIWIFVLGVWIFFPNCIFCHGRDVL